LVLGPRGVRVTAILPGRVVGDRWEGQSAARPAATGRTVDAMRDDYIQKTSLRRMVSAQDVAAMSLFLCSPAARNVTGQAISVDANLESL
jgi:NAD(P)-dependent dehydrogenase (short-subunit alcohol dehydrogenase family)